MGKLVMLSILVAVLALPAIAARRADERRGLRLAAKLMLAFGVLYWLGVQYLTPAV